ncbi:MAG TPA: hypothetical protein VF702_03325 [Allosphingosinicella sp.]|jgi:hypothetical protein
MFQLFLDPGVARATVTVQLGDATMNGVTLDYRQPASPFSLAAGACRIDGSLMLRVNEAPSVSTIYVDAVVTGPADGSTCSIAAPAAQSGAPPPPTAFRGDLVQWRTPERLVLMRDRHIVAGMIAVQVDVVPNAAEGQAVELSFFNGSQLLWSTVLSQTREATLLEDLVSGTSLIKAGARFTMTPPTAAATGNVRAVGLTIFTGGTSVDASGVLSSWPAPPPGPPPGPDNAAAPQGGS